MRIFYISDTRANGYVTSDIWRRNLYETLVEMGHEVVEFQGDLTETCQHLDKFNRAHQAFIERNRPLLSAEILKQVEAAHREKPLDLFFSYLWDACVTPETIDAIGALGMPTVNWYCNGSFQMNLVSDISPHFSYCLVPEKFRMDDYRALGANPIYCQEAANPNYYKKLDVPQDLDVAFVGMAYGERPKAIADLIETGIDARVWGPLWTRFTREGQTMRMQLGKAKRAILRQPSAAPVWLPAANAGGILSDEDLVKTFNRAKINLGFSSCGETHRDGERIVQIRLRDFEVPMSGGFYLVEHMDELEEFFELGKEIETYRDFDEMTDKIRFYLKHDEKRETIRKAGFERAHRDHTWTRRFEMVFEHMGLKQS